MLAIAHVSPPFPPAVAPSFTDSASLRDDRRPPGLSGLAGLSQTTTGKYRPRRLFAALIGRHRRFRQEYVRAAVRLVRAAGTRAAHRAHRELGIGASGAG